MWYMIRVRNTRYGEMVCRFETDGKVAVSDDRDEFSSEVE